MVPIFIFIGIKKVMKNENMWTMKTPQKIRYSTEYPAENQVQDKWIEIVNFHAVEPIVHDGQMVCPKHHANAHDLKFNGLDLISSRPELEQHLTHWIPNVNFNWESIGVNERNQWANTGRFTCIPNPLLSVTRKRLEEEVFDSRVTDIENIPALISDLGIENVQGDIDYMRKQAGPSMAGARSIKKLGNAELHADRMHPVDSWSPLNRCIKSHLHGVHNIDKNGAVIDKKKCNVNFSSHGKFDIDLAELIHLAKPYELKDRILREELTGSDNLGMKFHVEGIHECVQFVQCLNPSKKIGDWLH